MNWSWRKHTRWSNWIFSPNPTTLAVGEAQGDHGSALLIARRGPAPKTKNSKIERKIYWFKKKKERRSKGINASQLAIEISMIFKKRRKSMNTLCVLYFYVVFFKKQNVSSTFSQKTLLPVTELVKICLFPEKPFHVKNVFNMFNLCSERNGFYVK